MLNRTQSQYSMIWMLSSTTDYFHLSHSMVEGFSVLKGLLSISAFSSSNCTPPLLLLLLVAPPIRLLIYTPALFITTVVAAAVVAATSASDRLQLVPHNH